jgi:putative transposase
MIDRTHSLPVTRQCQLLNLNRSSVYYQPMGVSDEDLRLMRLIDEIHLKRPFYGSRRIRDDLQEGSAPDAADGDHGAVSKGQHQSAR